MIKEKLAEKVAEYSCEKCNYICSKKCNYDKHIMTLKHINRQKVAKSSNEKVAKNTEKYICYKCDYICSKKSDFDKHILTLKHFQRESSKKVADNFCENISEKFMCYCCDYICSKKCNFDKHVLTLKHIRRESSKKVSKNSPNNYICDNCNKKYKYVSSLNNHKQKCINTTIKSLMDENTKIKQNQTELIELFKKQGDCQSAMIEIVKNNTQIINIASNNTINKTFNLQFFLNETCKDAMNISDFIKTIQIPLSDLEKVGKVGYVNGITNIIVNNLNALDITKRPVHCSDVKREIIYVKDNGVWEKETEDNNKMRNVIKHVSYKNIGRIRDWRSIHSDYNETSSITSDIYQQIISGSNDVGRVSTDDSENKIIKKVIKNVFIDKTIV